MGVHHRHEVLHLPGIALRHPLARVDVQVEDVDVFQAAGFDHFAGQGSRRTGDAAHHLARRVGLAHPLGRHFQQRDVIGGRVALAAELPLPVGRQGIRRVHRLVEELPEMNAVLVSAYGLPDILCQLRRIFWGKGRAKPIGWIASARFQAGRGVAVPAGRRERRQKGQHLDPLAKHAIDLRVAPFPAKLALGRLHVLPFEGPVAVPCDTRLAGQADLAGRHEGVVDAADGIPRRPRRHDRHPKLPGLDLPPGLRRGTDAVVAFPVTRQRHVALDRRPRGHVHQYGRQRGGLIFIVRRLELNGRLRRR